MLGIGCRAYGAVYPWNWESLESYPRGSQPSSSDMKFVIVSLIIFQPTIIFDDGKFALLVLDIFLFNNFTIKGPVNANTTLQMNITWSLSVWVCITVVKSTNRMYWPHFFAYHFYCLFINHLQCAINGSYCFYSIMHQVTPFMMSNFSDALGKPALKAPD